MKKILLMLALMLPCLGVMAQNATTHEDGVYKIFWEWNGRGYLTYHADYPNDPQLAGVTLGNYGSSHYALNDADIQLSWYLYTSPKTGKTYLFEATTGKFITIDPNTAVSSNSKKCVLSEQVSEHAQLDLKATTNTPGFMLSYNNYNFCSGCGSAKGQNPVRFATDGQTDGGIPFVFVSEGASIAVEVKNAAIAKINAFEQISTTYTIKSVNRGFLYYDSNNADYVTSSSHTNLVDATPTGAENEQFAFLRGAETAEGQYYLYSKAAQKFVTYKSVDGVKLQLTENPEHAWEVASATWGNNSGVTIKVPETTQTYINITNWGAHLGCKVTSTGVDAGNLMTITAVTGVDLTAAIAKIQDFEEAEKRAERERVFAEIRGLIEQTRPLWSDSDALYGFGGDAYELFQGLDYAAKNEVGDLEDLKNNIAELRRLLTLSGVKKFLRIKAVAGWNDDAPYLGAKNTTVSDKTTRAEYVAGADKNTIFYYDGSSLLSYGSGNYLVSNSDFLGYNGVQSEGSKVAFKLASNGLSGAYNITFNDGGRYLYVDENNYTNAGSGTDNTNGYCFNLEFVTKIPVTISAAKYASFYAPVAVNVPEGVIAYSIETKKNVNGIWYANLTEIGNVIPQNTGVLLFSEEPNTYEFEIVDNVEEILSYNCLKGTVASAYIEADSYVLSNKDGIGLYTALKNFSADNQKVNEGGTKWLNNGFKSYLPAEDIPVEAQSVIRFSFGGETTAIESVLDNGADANAPIYDLSGRRVVNAVKGGIYIQNGKKFIVK